MPIPGACTQEYLAEEEEPYTVEELDEPRALPGGRHCTHDVFYDDVLAHAYDDLVEESVIALQAVPGVTLVVHEDREYLLVGAPGLSAEDLRRELDRFWRGAAAVDRPSRADRFEPPAPAPGPAAPTVLPRPAGSPASRPVGAAPGGRRRPWTSVAARIARRRRDARG